MNILILRVSSIGDVVHTLPSIFFLKKLYPKAKISWVVQRKAASLLKQQPFLENVWVLPDKFLRPSKWPEAFKIIKEMRKTQWDAILDFQGIIKTSALLLFLKGESFGFDSKNSRLGITSIFTKNHVSPKYTNIIQKNLALVSSTRLREIAETKGAFNPNYRHASPAIEAFKNDFYLSIPRDCQEIVNFWLIENDITNFIAIAPNTTWQSKHWPLEYWKKLAIQLSRSFKDYKVVLIGKSFGKYADVLHEYAQKTNLEVFSAPEWDLITTTFLMAKAQLLIGPDTGLLHLADFLGIQTIGIFGPTLAHRHGPFLYTNNIKNCIQIDCPHRYQKSHGASANPNCMNQLKPEKVFENIKHTLG